MLDKLLIVVFFVGLIGVLGNSSHACCPCSTDLECILALILGVFDPHHYNITLMYTFMVAHCYILM